MEDVDLVVDATANAAYTDTLSSVASRAMPSRPVVAVALHRRGAIGRVRVEVDHSAPLTSRSSATGFPSIQSLPLERDGRWETGCGAPINNAPPWAVAAVAALATRTAVDVLMGRITKDLDLIDVYEPFAPPFDRRGLIEVGLATAPG